MIFSRVLTCSVALTFGLILLQATLDAQTSRGTVTGMVTDAQKAAIPGAKVDLTGLATNVTRSTQTNESGLYRFDAVDPGEYKLAVHATGFRTASAAQFTVSAAQVATQDATLDIGDMQQVVEVSSSAVALQVEAPVRGGAVQTRQILDLPYATRDPADLGLTMPGVTTSKFATPSNTFVVNGARGRSNNFMIDGTDNNDISVAGQLFRIINPGSIQEVSVQTTNYDAEFGRAGGAVVNLITKSGTNSLHGDAAFVLDSTRDDAISSSLSQDPAIRARGKNNAGTEQRFEGTLGGPIKRDHTFFQLGYVETRQFSTSTSEMVSPSAAGRATLLRLFPRGRNANADLLQDLTAGFDGNQRLFTQALSDGTPIEFGRIVTPYAQSERIRQYGPKIDTRFGSKDMLSGRFLIHDVFGPAGGENLSFPSFITGGYTKIYNYSLYHTHIFSPTMTNELRPGYTRFNVDFPVDSANPLGKTLAQISIAGINTGAQSIYGVRSSFPQGRLFNNFVLQDTMSIVRGTHTFRFGVDLMEQRARQAAPFNARGTLSYNASSTGSNFTGLANFLDDFGGGGGAAARAFGTPFYYPSLFRQSYFFQDRWRASQSVTLSLGLRYEYFGLPMNVVLNPVYSGLNNVNPATGDSPLLHPNKVAADRNNWGPTLGIAYSPNFDSGLLGRLFGNHKSVLRLGYAMGYDSYFNNITSNIAASAPTAVSDTKTAQSSTAQPRGLPELSKLLPKTPPPITPFLTQTSVYGDIRNPYYQRWSAGIQREIRSGVVLDLAYVGSKGTRLFETEDGNPTVTPELRAPVPANVWTTQREARLDPLQGGRTVRTNGGSSIYHALQIDAKRRFANGFTFTTAYTYSKVIDNGSEIFSYGNTSTLQNSSVPAFFGGLQIDRGLAFTDRTHRLVFTYLYELPFRKSQSGVLGHVVGGWQLSGVTSYESGVPYSVVNGQDADGLGGSSFDRPDFNPAGRPGVRAVPDSRSPTGYINPDNNGAPIDRNEARYIGVGANRGNGGIARTAPGNLGRNTERGPGLKNWDVNIVKNTNITERIRLEFRTEFFNIWNTPMYGKVSVSPFSPPQNSQTIAASVFNSQPGLFLNETAQDGGGRVIRYQLRLRF